MVFRSVRINIILRLGVIVTLLFLAIYSAVSGANYLRSTYFILFSSIAVYELFRYLDRTNRRVTMLFKAILEGDFTTTFSIDSASATEKELYKVLNQITGKFQQIGAEREAQFLFMKFLIEHLAIGILVFDQEGGITAANESFKRITAVPHASSLKILEKYNAPFYRVIKEIRDGEVRMFYPPGGKKYSVTSTSFIIDHNTFQLVSFQNIEEEMEAGEVEAWKKLISVLTHEIMNSVTPITSLTDTLLDITNSSLNKDKLEGEALVNVRKGLGAIKDRNNALFNFTNAYKDLTRIPAPQKTVIKASDLISQLKILMSTEFEKQHIYVHYNSAPKDLHFTADQNQILQVILNLFKNAIQALDGISEPKIYFSISKKENDQISIMVEDNGKGILEENIGKIFVPFYTTRKNGTGIGLPLSREIVRLHGGRLNVISRPKEHLTRFTIVL